MNSIDNNIIGWDEGNVLENMTVMGRPDGLLNASKNLEHG